MRNGSNVFDHCYLKTCCLERTDSGFSALSGTLDINLNVFHAVLHRSSCGSLSSGLRGKGSRLLGTSEAQLACACP